MRTFGLIGYPLSHSFSEKYFSEKFKKENSVDAEYKLFPIPNIADLTSIITIHPTLVGLNVTIPYKEAVIPFLDEQDEIAAAIGAVNCIKITQQKLTGYNTDAYGFRETLKPILKSHHDKALILGTGGAAKAVEYVLKKIGIDCYHVSRHKAQDAKLNTFSYEELNKNIIEHFKFIINTTPLGMYPKTDTYPLIPYEYLNENHLLYDLIYNPKETIFLKKGKEKGAATQNGLAMLQLQAEKSWEIWNSK